MFTGLKSSVENAKLMLEYHMEHLKVQIVFKMVLLSNATFIARLFISWLKIESSYVDQQLRQLQIPSLSN